MRTHLGSVFCRDAGWWIVAAGFVLLGLYNLAANPALIGESHAAPAPHCESMDENDPDCACAR